jgi:phenylalanyl-tRNA synthetase beta chain
LNNLLPGLTVTSKNLDNSQEFLDSALEFFNNDISLGLCGKVKKDHGSSFDIDQDIFLFQVNLEILKKISIPKKTFNELLKFPKVYRDCAFIIDSKIGSDQVAEVIKENGTNLLHNVKLFDIFQSESLGSGKKSLAFQLEYYDPTRTLTEEEIEKIFNHAVKSVEKEFNAQLRGA